MYRRQLTNHVKAKILAGVSKENIRNDLISDGWSVQDVDDAIYYNLFPEKIKGVSIKRMLRHEVPMSLTIICMIVIAIAIGGISYFYSNPILDYTINLPSNPPGQDNQFTYGSQEALSNPDFFGKVKQQFLNDKASFIEADLSAMTLRVYKDGILSIEVPINSKGHVGSWWETPAGLYKVENKEKAHFSGMGHVWMPWSMNFQGNFFIHGKTYYPDGTPTSKTYTGGCIRLETEDAKKVYDAIDIGTPVLVFENNFTSDNYVYTENISTIDAPIYLSVDMRNNHVFSGSNSTEQVPIASITKLMTALVTTEYINLDNTATVPKEAIVFTSKARLKPGMQLTIYQLLFPLLMESSNEAAETIARFYGRASFVKHMNEKAAAIGMTHTVFTDPSGASEGNVSTAEDLFMLAKYIYNNRSFIFNITSNKLKSNAYGSSGFSDLGNFNDFIDNRYFFGGKNGKTTAALETNISVFELPVGTTTRPIVTIILKSPNEKKDAEALLNNTMLHLQ